MLRCPTCGAATRVLITRGEVRRRECPDGHRFTTTEVVVVVKRTPAQLACDQLARGIDNLEKQRART